VTPLPTTPPAAAPQGVAEAAEAAEAAAAAAAEAAQAAKGTTVPLAEYL
jgi:hypothetical protein